MSMSQRIRRVATLAAASLSLAAGAATTAPAVTPELGRIGDPKAWRVINGETRVAEEAGRRVLHLAPIGGNRKGSNVALALVEGVDFDEGTIEIDLKGGPEGQASFLGIAFGVKDERVHEAAYFRPFNFVSPDPVRRAHAVQYVAWPEYTWEKLRADKPGAYEAAVAPVPDPAGWFHARVEVTARRVRIFVDHAAEPCLAVDRLGGAAPGRVGLWVDSQEGSFAGLTIVRRR